MIEPKTIEEIQAWNSALEAAVNLINNHEYMKNTWIGGNLFSSLKKPLPSPEPENAEPDWRELADALCMAASSKRSMAAAGRKRVVSFFKNRDAATMWRIEDIRRILNSVQSTLFAHIGPYPKSDTPVSEHSPHCGCGECKKLHEAKKPERVLSKITIAFSVDIGTRSPNPRSLPPLPNPGT